MEFIAAFMHLLSFYPFTWDQTILLAGVIKLTFDALMKHNWKTAEKIVIDQAMPLVMQALDNETKRDLVVKAVWNQMPKTLRAFASPEQVEKFVDQIYVTMVKPEARRKGLLNKTEIDGLAIDATTNLPDGISEFKKQ